MKSLKYQGHNNKVRARKGSQINQEQGLVACSSATSASTQPWSQWSPNVAIFTAGNASTSGFSNQGRPLYAQYARVALAKIN